jgi:hypothetical protein
MVPLKRLSSKYALLRHFDNKTIFVVFVVVKQIKSVPTVLNV